MTSMMMEPLKKIIEKEINKKERNVDIIQPSQNIRINLQNNLSMKQIKSPKNINIKQMCQEKQGNS